MEDLEKAATAQGISYEDFKQNMRNQIITQKVIGEEVGSHLSITKDEQQKFYDEHKNEMEQPGVNPAERDPDCSRKAGKPIQRAGNNAADLRAGADSQSRPCKRRQPSRRRRLQL